MLSSLESSPKSQEFSENFDTPWYSVISDSEPISQGDIFLNCPVFFPKPAYNFAEYRQSSEVPFQSGLADVIILTQACDLNSNNGGSPNVQNVVVAQIDPASNETQNFLSTVRKNQRPAYHLLNHRLEAPEMEFQVVDFTNLYTLPYDLLMAFRKEQGPRLRLNSPYLEFLSQRFGLFFSRIGIPDKYTIDDRVLKAATKG